MSGTSQILDTGLRAIVGASLKYDGIRGLVFVLGLGGDGRPGTLTEQKVWWSGSLYPARPGYTVPA